MQGMIVASAPVSDKPSIQSMKERHHEIKRRLVAGEKAIDIAKAMGMTTSWLSIVMSSPVFQIEMEKERALADKNAADISGRIKNLAPDAMKVLERAIRGRDDGKTIEGITEAKRADLALESLALAGHGKPLAQSASNASVKVEILQFNVPAPTGQAPIEVRATLENEHESVEVSTSV